MIVNEYLINYSYVSTYLLSAPTPPFHSIMLYNIAHQLVIEITSNWYFTRFLRAAQFSTLPWSVEKISKLKIFTMMVRIQCNCKIIFNEENTIIRFQKRYQLLTIYTQEAMSTSKADQPSSSRKICGEETLKPGKSCVCWPRSSMKDKINFVFTTVFKTNLK